MPIGKDAESIMEGKNEGIIGINFNGVVIIDKNESPLLRLTFMEISGVSVNRNLDDVAIAFVITTVRGKDYQFGCQNCADVRELIATFNEGLRSRSKYVVAMQANPDKVGSGSEGSKFLRFRKGDLIMLDEPAGENLLTSSWASGTNASNNASGDFPVDCVWVLPTLTKPAPEIVALFKLSRSELENLASKAPNNQFNLNENFDTIFTLEDFSREHFNIIMDNAGMFSFKPRTRELSWSKSQEPLKQPLMRSLAVENHEGACNLYINILKYCGDYPSRKPKQGNELTDVIFEIPLEADILREVYNFHRKFKIFSNCFIFVIILDNYQIINILF
jgi:myosin-7